MRDDLRPDLSFTPGMNSNAFYFDTFLIKLSLLICTLEIYMTYYYENASLRGIRTYNGPALA